MSRQPQKFQELNLPLPIQYTGLWSYKHKHKLVHGGEAVNEFAEINKKNALMDEGEEQILEVYFRGQAPPASLYIGLGNNGGTPGIPAETATLATITEVSGTGYGRIALARNSTDFPTSALDAGDWHVVSVAKTFTGGAGGWTAGDFMFLTDVASGTVGALIACVALSASRVLLENDTLDVSIDIKLQ